MTPIGTVLTDGRVVVEVEDANSYLHRRGMAGQVQTHPHGSSMARCGMIALGLNQTEREQLTVARRRLHRLSRRGQKPAKKNVSA